MRKSNYWIALIFIAIAFAGEGKISGLAFFDYTYSGAEDAVNGFGFTRVYFTYQQEISDGIKYKFQTDIDYHNNPKTLYLKNAKIDWSLPVGKMTIGLQGMNVFNVQEKTWGYRFMEKSPMDLHKWASSADMGIGFSETIRGQIHVSTLYTNGTGYKKSENDSYKKLSIQMIYGEKKLVKKDGFNLGGLVSLEPYDYEEDSVTTNQSSKTVVGVFGGYSGKGIRTGGEFERLVDTGSDKTKQLISVYAKYELSEGLEVLGRYDLYDPDLSAGEDAETYVIAGVSYSPGKGLVIVPNIRYTPNKDTADEKILYKLNFEFKF